MTSGIKKSNEEVLSELQNILQDDFLIIGEYNGGSNPITFQHLCGKCKNYIFSYKNSGAFLSKVRHGKITHENFCPICSGKIRERNNEIIDLLIFSRVGNEYTRISDYGGKNNIPIMMRHNCDECNNYQWPVTTNHFLATKDPSRCPECANLHRNDKNRKTPEKFRKEFEAKANGEYSLLTEYGRSNKQKVIIKHNCEKCNNYIYSVRPNDFLSGERCPKCFGTPKKTTIEFQEELNLLFGENIFIVLDEYINNDTKIKIRHNCSICKNHEWETTPHNLLHNTKYGCPECARIINESKAVNTIKIILAENKINYETEKIYNNCKYKNLLKIDFLINYINLEYDGRQHFCYGFGNSKEKRDENVELQQNRDSVKNDFCLNNNLFLIRIPYIEESNLEIILDAIINYNEELLKEHNCLIIKNSEIINKPDIYSWYNENSIILNESEE